MLPQRIILAGVSAPPGACDLRAIRREFFDEAVLGTIEQPLRTADHLCERLARVIERWSMP